MIKYNIEMRISIFATESLDLEIIKIDLNSIYTTIVLIKLDIIFLPHISVKRSEIQSLKTIIIYLVYSLIIFVFKDEYSLLFYDTYLRQY